MTQNPLPFTASNTTPRIPHEGLQQDNGEDEVYYVIASAGKIEIAGLDQPPIAPEMTLLRP